MIEHNIKPFVDGSLVREMQGYRIRIKFEGKLTLVNNRKIGVNDYDLFKQIESLNTGKTIFIEIKSDSYTFNGYFYPFNCFVNDDNCTVELPELFPVDEYTIFDEYGDVKYNLIEEIPPYLQVNINEPVRMEYYTCQSTYDTVLNTISNCLQPNVSPSPDPTYQNLIWNGLPNDPFMLPQNIGWHIAYEPKRIFSAWGVYNDISVFPYGIVGTQARTLLVDMTRIVKNEVTINNQVSGWVYNITVKTTWALEIQYAAYNQETGLPQPPAGGGWALLDSSEIIHGVPHSKYGRIPFYNRYIVDGDEQTYKYNITNQSCGTYFEYSLINPYNGGSYNSSIAYRGRPLANIFQFFASKMGLSQTTSQFFYNQINPITGLPNKTYSLHTVKDIYEPTAADTSPLMEMSWNDLILSLQGLFPIDWVMNNGKLYIEHQKYFENGFSYLPNNSIYDVRGLQNNSINKAQIIRTNNYTYDESNIFNIETFNTPQFITEEFKPVSIIYGIFTKEKKENIRLSQFITDAGGVFTDPGTFGDNAIVIIGARYLEINTGNFQWECEAEQDYLSQLTVCNGHLSSSNLITKYWMDYRQFIIGNFELNNITFNSETKKKLQNISISDCNVVYLQTNNLIKTNLGVGRIISSRHNLLQRTTELTLLIGYAEN